MSAQLGTTIPEESTCLKHVIIKGASSVAQLTNNEDGMPLELGESLCMASIVISSDNTISVKYTSVDCSMDGCLGENEEGLVTIFSGFGLVNILLKVSNRSHICH